MYCQQLEIKNHLARFMYRQRLLTDDSVEILEDMYECLAYIDRC